MFQVEHVSVTLLGRSAWSRTGECSIENNSSTHQSDSAMSLVTVFTTFSPIEAQLICSRLDAAGLLATVTNEASALSVEGGAVTVGGVHVQVPEAQAGQAREIIDAKDEPTS